MAQQDKHELTVHLHKLNGRWQLQVPMPNELRKEVAADWEADGLEIVGQQYCTPTTGSIDIGVYQPNLRRFSDEPQESPPLGSLRPLRGQAGVRFLQKAIDCARDTDAPDEVKQLIEAALKAYQESLK